MKKEHLLKIVSIWSCLFFVLLVSTQSFAEYVKFRDSGGEHQEATNPNGNATEDIGGLFLGAAANFGETLATEGGWVPKVAYNFSLELGYNYPMSSWSLISPSVEVFSGKAAYRTTSDAKEKVDIPIGFGMLLKFGYGYSLGSGIFGIWEAGFGPVNTKFKATDKYDNEVSSDGTIWGLASQLGFLVTVPISDMFGIASGIKWTHIAFDVDDVDVKSGGTTTSENLNRSVNINIPEVQLGFRLNF